MDISGYSKFGGILIETKLAETLQDEYDGKFPDFDDEESVNRMQGIAELNEMLKIEKAENDAEKKAAEKKRDKNIGAYGTSDWVDPLQLYRGPKHQLFYDSDVDDFITSFESSCVDEQHKARTSAMLKGLLKTGQFRKLATIPRQYRRDIESLRDKFPNFSEVLDYIGSCCEIASRTDGVLRMTPILLTSAPGVGKTTFVASLGSWLQSGFHQFRLESAQSGSSLSGSSSFWQNCQPGRPFTMLTQKQYANPVFFLDELDKSSGGQYDPLGPLHGLLDESSREFSDLCYELPIDASAIMWIGAVNDAEKVPAPLRSRFREFKITITAEQSATIAKSIVHETIDSLQLDLAFAPDAFKALSTMSPRRIKQAVTEGIGRALGRDADVVNADDIAGVEVVQRRMGFLS